MPTAAGRPVWQAVRRLSSLGRALAGTTAKSPVAERQTSPDRPEQLRLIHEPSEPVPLKHGLPGFFQASGTEWDTSTRFVYETGRNGTLGNSFADDEKKRSSGKNRSSRLSGWTI